MDSIIFFRGSQEDSEEQRPDPYIVEAEKWGFVGINIPVLESAVSNQSALLETLTNDVDQLDALVATSKRAVESLALVWGQVSPEAKAKWKARPFYIVGASSIGLVESMGFSPSWYESGTAESLAEHIVLQRTARHLLFLRGDKTLDHLTKRLDKMTVRSLVVYETRAVESGALNASVSAAFETHSVRWLAFFSPSGAKSCLLLLVRVLAQAHIIRNRSTRIACIGPTTAAFLRHQNLLVDAVADSPTPNSLLAAISNNNN